MKTFGEWSKSRVNQNLSGAKMLHAGVTCMCIFPSSESQTGNQWSMERRISIAMKFSSFAIKSVKNLKDAVRLSVDQYAVRASLEIS